MCSPMPSLYPPVLTPLGGRPPGNKSRLSDTLHHSTHTLSPWSTKKKWERERKGCAKMKGGRMERAKGKWAALDGVDVCRRESEKDKRKG